MISEQLNREGTVICRFPGSDTRTIMFSSPVEIVTTCCLDEVLPCMAQIERAGIDGRYAAGFISYEASPAFDPAYPHHPLTGKEEFPLLWFGIYDNPPECIDLKNTVPDIDVPLPEFSPAISFDSYAECMDRIKFHIAEGDIYQVNYTIRAMADSEGIEPARLFEYLCVCHPVPYAAWVNTGDIQLVSISPELFLDRNGNSLTSSPMKGTIKREPLPSADRQAIEFLRNDEKNRAENLMITDMVRNDLGRVCKPGTVGVDPLFQVDTYRSVHQMISTVHGEVTPETGFIDIMRAAFPAASITGAPKIRAMELINTLEPALRKAYTGSIGCMVPGGDFCFNVAIRTMIFKNGKIELGIGGGIVADSQTKSEWEESLLKSSFASSRPDNFRVLETMLYRPDAGIILLEEHLCRACVSQEYFGRVWLEEITREALQSEVRNSNVPLRVRMTLGRDGIPDITAVELKTTGWGTEPVKLKISAVKTCSNDLLLYHKTTRRELYDNAFHDAVADGFGEIIFMNERGEITEGAISNIFIRVKEQWMTPLVTCGLLPGTMRSKMIEELGAIEKVITLDQLSNADEILVCNSVRGCATAVISDISCR